METETLTRWIDLSEAPMLSHPVVRSATLPGKVLSIDEAIVAAEKFVRLMRPGVRFTCMKLFEGVAIEGKKNVSRMAVMRYLQCQGIIRAVGGTTKDQETRNHGWATEWEVCEW